VPAQTWFLVRNLPSSGVRVYQATSQPVSDMLQRRKNGNHAALEKLAPVVYGDPRDTACHCLRGKRPEHTLQSAALSHEPYLHPENDKPCTAENRVAFLRLFLPG
jgi:ECF sigma factor